MNPPDRRTKAEILQHPRWDPLLGDPKIDTATVDNLRILDDFLRYIEERQIADTCALTAADFLNYDHKNTSSSRLARLRRGMEAIFPGHPAVLPLREAIRQKDHAYLSTTAIPKAKPRKLSKSVPYSELPGVWRSAFDDMEAGFDRNGEIPPTAGMMPTLKMKARQLLRSARDAGLPDELSARTVRAYARDLRERQLAAATLRASFSALLKFARYIGADAHTVELLSDLSRVYETEAQKAPKQKFKHLQNTGYSTVALIKKAEHLLSDANTLPCPRRRHAQRNRAAAIALFSVMPVRLADTRLRFGETLFWTDGSYLIDTRLSKNSYTWSAKIDLRLNKFIDALILRDCAADWLDQMRNECLSSNRALFITHDEKPVAYNYVSDAWRREVGTGEHIARTVLHTLLGVELGQAGTDKAMAACGQISHETASAYQGRALAMAQRMKGQQEIAGISDPTDEKLFAFI
ncbi:hypothetical protein SAMN05444279_11412 [Ruegeria intermedia]|uniref:Uncharacterized protein n=1 Tax=Ruegeria intermedia TaxID=996115 RepID=A0A1M4Y5L9_9RHOB|nr:hypothetical protein [Ruegeria intermedia]SHF00970.1 hypothetical protein SAMN05444279_11412 [Ruegeria intermedia]